MCLVSNSGCSEQHNRRHRDPGKKPGLQPVRHERSTRQEREARNRCCNRAGQTRLKESIDKVANRRGIPSMQTSAKKQSETASKSRAQNDQSHSENMPCGEAWKGGIQIYERRIGLQELGFVDYRKQDFKVAIIRIVSKSAPARLASPF